MCFPREEAYYDDSAYGTYDICIMSRCSHFIMIVMHMSDVDVILGMD